MGGNKSRKIGIVLVARDDTQLDRFEERLLFILDSLQRSLLSDGTARIVRMDVTWPVKKSPK